MQSRPGTREPTLSGGSGAMLVDAAVTLPKELYAERATETVARDR